MNIVINQENLVYFALFASCVSVFGVVLAWAYLFWAVRRVNAHKEVVIKIVEEIWTECSHQQKDMLDIIHQLKVAASVAQKVNMNEPNSKITQ